MNGSVSVGEKVKVFQSLPVYLYLPPKVTLHSRECDHTKLPLEREGMGGIEIGPRW